MESHPDCAHDPLWLPTRVLDVQHSDLYLRSVSPADILERYATLSYIWGADMPVKLLCSNFSEMQHSIDLTALPKTFLDAVEIVRAIGIRYLWIDALCIIQDSREDWEREAASMSHILMNSFLNIAAGSKSCQLGFFTSRHPPPFRPCILKSARQVQGRTCIGWLGSDGLYDATGIHTEQYPNKWRYDNPLLRRAWTFQEMLLSPRQVVFQPDSAETETMETISQLYFRCRTCIFWENGRRREKQNALTEDSYAVWYSAVEEFSGRYLTYISDRLVAFSAVAEDYNKIFNSRYLAGLWEDDLIRGLLWHQVQGTPSRYPTYVAPSWSWASSSGRVAHCWTRSDVAMACLLETEIELRSRSLYGMVVGGSITISGMLTQFCLYFEKKGDTSMYAFPSIVRPGEPADLNMVFRCWYDIGEPEMDSTIKLLRITKRCGLILRNIGEGSTYYRIGLMIFVRGEVDWFEHCEESIVKIV